VLDDGAEVFDRNHNVKLVFNIDVVKLVSLYGD
jgi:hypothetical protein